jgi:hypothetical protein
MFLPPPLSLSKPTESIDKMRLFYPEMFENLSEQLTDAILRAMDSTSIA